MKNKNKLSRHKDIIYEICDNKSEIGAKDRKRFVLRSEG